MPNYNKSFNFRNGVQVDEDDLIVRSSLVGIGTTIPTSELDVRGDTKVSGVVTTSELYVTGISTFGDVHIGTGVTVYSSLGIISATKFQGDGSLLSNLPTSQWVDINESGIGVTSIYAIGNVGIGTTDPTGTTLQIGGDAQLGQPGVGIGSDGNIHASGIITATTYYGTGTNLTALNASNIASGKLAQSRLPANLDVTGNLTVSGVATVSGSGGLNVTHNLDVNGALDVDGQTDLDVLNVSETATFVNDAKFNGIAGVTSAYWDRSENTLKLLDDVKATFGNGEDLKIYHDSSTSPSHTNRIVAGSGQLLELQTDKLRIVDVGATKDLISANDGGQVTLFHAGNAKLRTSGVGVTVYNQLDVANVNVSAGATFQNNINVTKDIVVTGLATAGFVTTRDLYVSGISTLKRAYIDDLQLTGVTTSTGGYIGNNIRIGITAANEIDTSGGNLVLDSTGGTVEVTDNLTVSGISTGQSLFGTNISVTGVATVPTVKTQTVTTNSGNLTLDSASGTTHVNDNLNVAGVSTFVGVVRINSGITPDTDEGAYLGAPGSAWSSAHIGEVRIASGGNNNEIDTASGNLTLDSDGGSVIVDDILQTNIGILPDSDKGAYIGTSGKSYAEAYINDVTIGVGATTRISTRGGNLHLNSNEGKVVVDGNLSVSGITTLSNGLDFGDNVKVQFGQNDDLKLYHDSNHSYIEESGTGNLYILSSELVIQKPASPNENIAKFKQDNSVDLYYDNVLRFSTSGIGVTIFSQLDVNNINVSAGGTFAIVNVDNIKLDGNEVDTTSGNLTLDSAGGSVIVDDILTVQNGANINERFTANNESFLTQNVYVGSDLNDLFVGGGKVGIGTSIATNEFEVVKDSGNLVAEFVSRTGNTTIGLGQSIGIGNSSATVAYVGKNLDITNKTDDGDINVHLASGAPGSGIVTSSSFNVKYGSSTVIGAGYSGGVGINKAVPVIALDVVGSSAISEDLNVSGIVTATRFIGSGTSLTNIPAGQLTGVLPALDGSLLTGTDFSRWHNNSTGISTDRPVGIGTTTVNGGADPNNLTVLNAGIVTANYFYGDGSQLTNLPDGTVWDDADALSYVAKSVGIGTTVATDTLTVNGSLSVTGTTSLTGDITVGVDASVGIGTTANQSDSRNTFKTDFYNAGISTVGTIQVTTSPQYTAGHITGIDTTGLRLNDQLLGSTTDVGVSTIVPTYSGITTIGNGQIWIDLHPTNVAITTEVITFGKYTEKTLDFKYGESQHYGDVTFVGVGTNTGNTIVFAPGTTDNSVSKPEISYTNAGTGINTSYQAQSIVGINTLNPRSSLDLGGSKGYLIPPHHDAAIRQVSLEDNPNIDVNTRDPQFSQDPRNDTKYPNVVDGSIVYYQPKNRLEVGITTYATDKYQAKLEPIYGEGGYGDETPGTIGITTNRITGISTVGLEIGMYVQATQPASFGGPLHLETKVQGFDTNIIILDRLTTNSSPESTTFNIGYYHYPRQTQFLPIQTLGVSTHSEGFEYIVTPKLSTGDRDTLTTGIGFTEGGGGTGALVFNTTTNKMQCYDGTQWRDLW